MNLNSIKANKIDSTAKKMHANQKMIKDLPESSDFKNVSPLTRKKIVIINEKTADHRRQYWLILIIIKLTTNFV